MSKDNDLDVPRFATLFDCYKPVERYVRLSGAARAATTAAHGPARRAAPSVRIEPIDAFLLHQMAALYPTEPGILDLAADATGGASAAFWAAHPAVAGVRVAAGEGEDVGAAEEGAAWRQAFADVASRMGIPAGACTFDADAAPGDPTDESQALFVSAAAPDTSPADVVRLLQRIVARHPTATVLLLNVGPAGEGPGLEGVVSFCSHGSPYRLVLAREMSPFFAASRLAVVCPREDERAAAVLRRIAGAFDGNFRFLSLVEAVVAAAQRVTPEPTLPTAATAAPRGRQRRSDPAEYAAMVDRIRQAVHEQVPADAVVLSVSRGDDALLDLGGRAARHFPEAEQGGYAGFHPRDDAAAIEQLERQRSRGGQFLLFPATALWWLEHYGQFRRHLETNYRVAVCRPATCMIFDVRGGAAVPAAANGSTKQADYARVVERVRDVASRVVPASAGVAVVSRGDPNLVTLEGRRGMHFPAAPGGAYAGYHPKDAAQAIRFLASARVAGARYLVFPATAFWWLDHYAALRRYLDTEAKTVWSDDACRVFELPTNGRAGRGAAKSPRPRATKARGAGRGQRRGHSGAAGTARNGSKKK